MVVPTGRDRPQGGLGPEFRKLWAASTLSNLGDGVTLVAAPLLAAALTRDPALVAGLAVAQHLPWLLFALLSGALADRLDRRRAMAAVGVGRAALIGALGVAVFLDRASLPLLYAVFFLLGVGETLFDTTAATVLPALVPREQLPRANARLSGTTTVANHFVGKPLGGLLFAAAAALPFLLGAGGIAAAAALILALRGTFRAARRAGAPPAALGAEIAEGIRWLWRHRLLRTLALALTLLNVTFVGWNSVLVLLALERLSVGQAGFGVLLTAHAAGAVLGSLVAARVIARLGPSRILRIALCIEAATPAVLALARGPLLAGAALAVFGCHALVWGALLTSLRQELIPDGLRGRVESVYRLLEYGGGAPGALLGGVLAARFSLAAPFWFSAITGALLIPLVWPTFSEATVAMARRDAGEDTA